MNSNILVGCKCRLKGKVFCVNQGVGSHHTLFACLWEIIFPYKPNSKGK